MGTPPAGRLQDSTEPLHKLLMSTFERMNVSTFSVHLSEASNISESGETRRRQIFGGLRPLSSSSYSDTSSPLVDSVSVMESSEPITERQAPTSPQQSTDQHFHRIPTLKEGFERSPNRTAVLHQDHRLRTSLLQDLQKNQREEGEPVTRNDNTQKQRIRIPLQRRLPNGVDRRRTFLQSRAFPNPTQSAGRPSPGLNPKLEIQTVSFPSLNSSPDTSDSGIHPTFRKTMSSSSRPNFKVGFPGVRLHGASSQNRTLSKVPQRMTQNLFLNIKPETGSRNSPRSQTNQSGRNRVLQNRPRQQEFSLSRRDFESQQTFQGAQHRSKLTTELKDSEPEHPTLFHSGLIESQQKEMVPPIPVPQKKTSSPGRIQSGPKVEHRQDLEARISQTLTAGERLTELKNSNQKPNTRFSGVIRRRLEGPSTRTKLLTNNRGAKTETLGEESVDTRTTTDTQPELGHLREPKEEPPIRVGLHHTLIGRPTRRKQEHLNNSRDGTTAISSGLGETASGHSTMPLDFVQNETQSSDQLTLVLEFRGRENHETVRKEQVEDNKETKTVRNPQEVVSGVQRAMPPTSTHSNRTEVPPKTTTGRKEEHKSHDRDTDPTVKQSEEQIPQASVPQVPTVSRVGASDETMRPVHPSVVRSTEDWMKTSAMKTGQALQQSEDQALEGFVHQIVSGTTPTSTHGDRTVTKIWALGSEGSTESVGSTSKEALPLLFPEKVPGLQSSLKEPVLSTGPELGVLVSPDVVEQQLLPLGPSSSYSVTVSSLQGALRSSPSRVTFTTGSDNTGGTNTGSGRGSSSDTGSSRARSDSSSSDISSAINDGPRDLQASNVTSRSAVLSWKPASASAGGYRLTYRVEGAGAGRDTKELHLDHSVTRVLLKTLDPGSSYMVELQTASGGQPASTRFSTGVLLYPFPSDCSQELLNGISSSSELQIFPEGEHGPPLTVYCDQETDGGGWTVFQRRVDGSLNFFRGWTDYVRGFGHVTSEFWLGLQALRTLTSSVKMSLRVDLRDQDHASIFASYSHFEVGPTNFRLTVGGYSGTAGDSLSYHNQRPFSTKDRDPSPFVTRCATSYRGGWWYRNCHHANLNGLYGVHERQQGIIWSSWRGGASSMSFSEMKMRPTAFRPPTTG